MAFWSEVLKRSNVHALRGYLTYGDGVDDEVGDQTIETYDSRLEKVYRECLQIVQTYDDKGEESELFAAINMLTLEHEQVYMEIGIRAGFLLAQDLLNKNLAEEETKSKYKKMYLSLFEDISKTLEELKKAQQKAEELYIAI